MEGAKRLVDFDPNMELNSGIISKSHKVGMLFLD